MEEHRVLLYGFQTILSSLSTPSFSNLQSGMRRHKGEWKISKKHLILLSVSISRILKFKTQFLVLQSATINLDLHSLDFLWFVIMVFDCRIVSLNAPSINYLEIPFHAFSTFFLSQRTKKDENKLQLIGNSRLVITVRLASDDYWHPFLRKSWETIYAKQQLRSMILLEQYLLLHNAMPKAICPAQ